MNDNQEIIRWNHLFIAQIATGVKRILFQLTRNRDLEANFKAIAETTIEFLEEAIKGGMILQGDVPAGNFTGTLRPYMLCKGVFEDLKSDNSEKDFTEELQEVLHSFVEVLNNILEEKSVKKFYSTVILMKLFFTRLYNVAITKGEYLL